MKKILTIAVLFLPFLAGKAQTVDTRVVSYSVRYEKEHLFLQKDSDYNVVDYDIEWPEVAGFSNVPELKRYISSELTGIATADYDSLLATLHQSYGAPVSSMMKTIPDDRRFCYVTATARIVGYEPNHWIAYYLSLNVEPGKLSSNKASSGERVVVYDLSRRTLSNVKDLISSSVVTRNEPQDFYDHLFAPLDDNFFNTMTGCEVEGVWVDGRSLNYLVRASVGSNSRIYTASMPLDTYAYALSRQGKRLFMKKAEAIVPKAITQPLTIDGDSIYNNVEQMPTFKGGSEAFKQYMSYASKPEVILSGTVKEYTSFVVDKNGRVRDVCVLKPINPVLDRHAAMTIKGLPDFVPGKMNGNNVAVRLYMPITYQP